MEITWEIIIIASITIYIAEVYGAIVGGGGFLVQPVFIALGMPHTVAVAHDVSACVGTNIGGTYVFNKSKSIRYEIVKYWLPGVAIGGVLGVFALVSVPSWVFEKILGILALISLIYILFLKKDTGIAERKLPKHLKIYALFFSIPIGAYVGFSGAGAGILTSFILVTIFKTTFIQGIAVRKVLHILPMITASGVYIYMDLLEWELAIPLLISATLAGYTGSLLALKIGDKIIKIIFITVVFLLAVWLLFK